MIIGLSPESDLVGGQGLTLFVAVRVKGTPSPSGDYRLAGTYITPVFTRRISDPDDPMPTYFDVNDIWSVGARGTAGASNGKFSFSVNLPELYTHNNGYDIEVVNSMDQSTESLGSSKGFVTIDGSKPDFLRGALTPSGNFGVFHQLQGYREVDGQEELLDTLGFFFILK